MKVTLCVLFNHPFPASIPVLRQIYAGRFSRIIFVQPIIASDDADVLRSFRGSYAHHGMIADLQKDIEDVDSDYYLFCHDDVMLNPVIDERNIVEWLALRPEGGFVVDCFPAEGPLVKWHWLFRTLWNLHHPMNAFAGTGLQNPIAYLPNANDVRAKMRALFGQDLGPITYEPSDAVPNPRPFPTASSSDRTYRAMLEDLFENSNGEIYPIYPLSWGVCDMFAVHRSVFKQFCEMLGVFAAADVFVEVAIPTALIASSSHVTRASDTGSPHDWFWHGETDEATLVRLERFPDGLLAVHPVKLSRMKDQILNNLDRWGRRSFSERHSTAPVGKPIKISTSRSDGANAAAQDRVGLRGRIAAWLKPPGRSR